MNHVTEPGPAAPVGSDRIPAVAGEPRPDQSGHYQQPDSRISQALEEYLAALEAGQRPDRQEFLARHAEIATELAKCLDGLEFIRTAAPQLHDPAVGQPGATPTAGAEEYPTTPLGDYRILREVGRGGMGVVYEAVQLSLGRRVALKVLPFAAALDAKRLQRFKNEAQAAAQLHHTNIVPVHAVGCERGVHFYAMQFIEGQTLAAVIQELRQQAGLDEREPAPSRSQLADEMVSGRLLSARRAALEEPPTIPQVAPPAQAPAPGTAPQAGLPTEQSIQSTTYLRTVAHLGVQAAEALEHAHQLGVVHRDIKPANLLVDGRGNLWITDFGLAQCQGQAGLTLTGDRVGTGRYMSPEQTLGKRGLVDHRTDLYSLGVTLYELLTLKPACEGDEWQEVMRQITEEEPRPPRQWNPALPVDLETVVLKAMAKEPESRYATAQELADDLRRWLEDKPIKAKRPSLSQRAAKWARRHRPVVVAATVATAVVVLLAVVGLIVSIVLITRERTQAEENYQGLLKTLDKITEQVVQKRLFHDPSRDKEYQELVRNLLQSYQEFVRRNGANPKVRHATGLACLHVGNLYWVLREHDRAEEHLRQAITFFDRLATDLPYNPDYRGGLAACYDSLGLVLSALDRPQEAEKAYRQAHDLVQKLAVDFPDKPDYRRDVATNLDNLGNLLIAINRPQDAEEVYQQALSLRKQLVKDYLKVCAYRQGLANSYNHLGTLFKTTNRLQEAEAFLRESVNMWEKLAADFPTEDSGGARVMALGNLSEFLLQQEKPEEARQYIEQAIQCEQATLKLNPWDPASHERLGKCYHVLASILLRLGKHAEAAQAAVERQRSVPEDGMACLHAASFLENCVSLAEADTQLSEKERRAAVQAYIGQAREQLNEAERRIHNDPVAQNEMASFLTTCQTVQLRDAPRAVALAEKAVEQAPKKGEFWNTLGVARYRAGNWQAAVAALEKSRQLRSGGDAFDFFFLAMAHWQLGDKAQARNWYDQAIKWMEHKPKDDDLDHFRDEAAALLGFAKPSLPTGREVPPEN
jgi:serine/threonine protein kinase/Flp pilus assembly protein TadD